MDDNFNDIIIYLVIIVISIIGSIIKGYNKKKQEQAKQQRRTGNYPMPSADTNPPVLTTNPETPRSANPFEEFLRRTLEEFEEPGYSQPEEVIIPEPVIAKTKPVDTIKVSPGKPGSYMSEGQAALEQTRKEVFSDNIFNENYALSNEIKDLEKYDYDQISKGEITDNAMEIEDFDAAKAVIYSEILKRPAYISN